MDRLNYHHLRYFREIAREGHLGRTAERLNVAQSALSVQLRQLEDRLGHPLFDRVGRSLELTEAGRIALDHADRVFGAGEALLATLGDVGTDRAPLRVGAQSTLSRNFQLQFLRPVLTDGAHPVALRSGAMAGLLEALTRMTLDVVLTTQVPPEATTTSFAARLIAEQDVALHGRPDRMAHQRLPDLLASEPLILPTESVIRSGMEDLLARLEITPRVAAEVDDMAMVRLLAREGAGVAVAPAVVMADEISNGTIVTAPFDLHIKEPFYAVTLPRQFPHPALGPLLDAARL